MADDCDVKLHTASARASLLSQCTVVVKVGKHSISDRLLWEFPRVFVDISTLILCCRAAVPVSCRGRCVCVVFVHSVDVAACCDVDVTRRTKHAVSSHRMGTGCGGRGGDFLLPPPSGRSFTPGQC